ncbi:hypothetical protein [Enterobacter roggenkampii]|uniref:hypothetical protein n=1 Tax=Enterobacter roggenkampii TaxID=1812935 RepID=UPI001013A35B|nr:hypothetical protein [Enterobacter roggenkampii]
MVMKLEGLGEGFCCRYALEGSLKGWLLRGRDMQSIIFIESPGSDEFIQALTKATADLQDRLGAEKQFMNNAVEAMSNTETEDTPRIFAGSLSDEELISFLEDVIVKLTSRRNLTGRPEDLREQAGEIEGRLKYTNDFINSIVYRQAQSPNQNP